MQDIMQLVETFLKIGSVSGEEGVLAACIAELARPYADEVFTDTLGNLIVRKRACGPKLMLCAHMDTTGLLATHVDKSGFVRFAPVGGLSATDILGAAVVFSCGTGAVVHYEEKTKLPDLELSHFYIDAGASDCAASTVRVGDRARFAGAAFETNGRLVSPYLDNYAGCAVLLRTLALVQEPKNDLCFVFSVQEEVGLRGARTSAFAIEPDWALVVDVTNALDIPEPSYKNECRLGGGPAVKLMDSSVVCHPGVVKHLEECAGNRGIAFQYDILEEGGTDAGAISLSGAGVPAGGVSIPTRYIHTAHEMADLSDISSCVSLLCAAMQATPVFA